MGEVIFLLDVSGSMAIQAHLMIKAINEQLVELAARLPAEVVIKIYNFNEKLSLALSAPLGETPQLKKYECDGGTALYDALGGLLSEIKNVTLIVATDGMDTSSKHYTREDVQKLVKGFGGTIIYLGEGDEAKQSGDELGFKDLGDTRNLSQMLSGQEFQDAVSQSVLGESFFEECEQDFKKLKK